MITQSHGDARSGGVRPDCRSARNLGSQRISIAATYRPVG
jgi:hypothetical protein